jgi:hypothetical protein
MNTVSYQGLRASGIGVVSRIGATGQAMLLDPGPSIAIRNHSPTGFEWGYTGSGPAQLALALLLDAGCCERVDLERQYQSFKREVVARMPRDGWTLTVEEIRGWSSGALERDYFSRKWADSSWQTSK